MPARMEFSIGLGRRDAPAATRRGDEAAMRLLVLGDFSGRPVHERPPLATRPTVRVDLDTLDEALRRLQPRVRLGRADGAAGFEVAFESLDDFHPDRLLDRVEVFAALRDLRQRLQDPARAAEAAAALRRGDTTVAAPDVTAAAPPPPPAAPDPGADLLGALLGGRPAPPAPTGTVPPAPHAAPGIEAFVRAIVAPHVVPSPDPQLAQLVAAVDLATASQMRAVLHDPGFQALEAAWRGVAWLVSALELDEPLQLHLFDVSRDEVLADIIGAGGQVERSGLHAALVDRWRNQPGGEPWSVLAGLWRFGPSDADIGLLAALGIVASQAGGPFLGDAERSLAGPADDPALAGWRTLRGSEVAPWIGLAAPRVLLRLPYGRSTDPIERFAFEELPGGPGHDRLLWGSAALACMLAIGRAFGERGWAFEPGDVREIGDLPAFVYTTGDGSREMQACAEHYLGEQALQALLDAGIMALASHRHRNAVTIPRFQSIASPAQGLAGLGASAAAGAR